MKKIGITSFTVNKLIISENRIGEDYLNSIIINNGLPVIIPLSDNVKLLQHYIDLVDGVLLTGGVDINPALYKEKNSGLSRNISEKRDFMEFQIIEAALKKGIPVLGICRGFQLINIFFGGNLYQDIGESIKTGIDHTGPDRKLSDMAHEVTIQKASELFKIYEKEKVSVNSRHHQALRDIGSDLTVSAASSDGIIEGIEYPASKVIAVQWHPENLTSLGNDFNRIFACFIEKC